MSISFFIVGGVIFAIYLFLYFVKIINAQNEVVNIKKIILQ